MNKYRLIKQIGSGTFGTVYLAEDLLTTERVAIKIIKKKSMSIDAGLKLRQVQALMKLDHPNIMSLKALLHVDGHLWMVCEHAQTNLYEMYVNKDERPSELTIKQIIKQIAEGLRYLHKNRLMHRDLKPQNILCTSGSICPKICDFGLTRSFTDNPPYSSYVSTRWYRAPQLIIRSTSYTSAVDIFALGCIMAQLYNGQALFPGATQADQIHKIFKILGTPSKEEWPELYESKVKFTYYIGRGLREQLPMADEMTLDLLDKMLRCNPKKRISARRILKHPYFDEITCKDDPTPNQYEIGEGKETRVKEERRITFRLPDEQTVKSRKQSHSQSQTKYKSIISQSMTKSKIGQDLISTRSKCNVTPQSTKSRMNRVSSVLNALNPESTRSKLDDYGSAVRPVEGKRIILKHYYQSRESRGYESMCPMNYSLSPISARSMNFLKFRACSLPSVAERKRPMLYCPKRVLPLRNRNHYAI